MTVDAVAGGVLGGFLSYVEALIGGIFGLYLILVVLRWYESRRLVNILKDIKHDIKFMAEHMGVEIKERETLVRKIKKKKSKKKK